jgi:RNA polymerase sigma factor (sigma-70 family)
MRLPPFQTLLDRYAGDVYRYLRASVGPVEAEDCFQETMLSALRAYPELRDDSNLRGWLLAIAHRKAIDAHRARARRPLPVVEPPERASVDATQQAEPALWRAVRQLPQKQRSAVFLRFVGDLDYAAIGAAIGCSEVAARQNVRAGLATIRKGWVR